MFTVVIASLVVQKRHIFTALFLLILIGFIYPVLAQETVAESPSVARPRPQPRQIATDGIATLALYFDTLPQGSTGVVHISGEGVQGARVRFLSDVTDFYLATDGYYALLPVGLDVTPRTYPLSVSVEYTDGTRTTIDTAINVIIGGFARQSFSVSPERAYLTAPEIERNEYARISSLLEDSSAEKLWGESGFSTPIDSEITSPFGAFRTLNENTQTRHTGWDFRAATGTPVKASADGIIVFAGAMDIRGNYVLIDHGFGVFSGYAHFSQIHVTPGQSVQQGQIIGVSGNTGRSNGPHLHWEIAVNREWIDSVAFTETWLP